MKAIDPYLEKSLSLAQSAVTNGNHPFGAVLIHRNRIVVEAGNTVNTDQDLTAHAEMNVIRKARKILSMSELRESVLYCSTEPCAMCSGAIYWAGIDRVVFGCSNRTLSRITQGSLEVPCVEIFKHGKRKLKVAGPIAEEQFRRIHDEFWD